MKSSILKLGTFLLFAIGAQVLLAQNAEGPANAPVDTTSGPNPSEAPDLDKMDKPSVLTGEEGQYVPWSWKRIKTEFKPSAGLQLSPMVTLGDLGQYIDTTYLSGEVVGLVEIPRKYTFDNFKFLRKLSATSIGENESVFPIRIYGRTGLGFVSAKSYDNLADKTSLTMFSLMPGLRVGYVLPFVPGFLKRIGMFEPVAGIDAGFSYTAMTFTPGKNTGSKAKAAWALDPSTALSVGTLFRLRAIPELLSVLECKFYSPFETYTGKFLVISVGALYQIK